MYLYHVPNEDSWNSLDLSKPASIINTQQEHINAVAIGDDGGGPCIVIATDGSFLTVIQWRRRKEENNGVKVEDINGLKIDTTNDVVSEDIANLDMALSNGLTVKEDTVCESVKCDILKKEQNKCAEQNKCVKQHDHAGMEMKTIPDTKSGENAQEEMYKEQSVHNGNGSSVEKTTESASKTRGLIVLNNEMMTQKWKTDMQFARMTQDDT